MPGWSEGIRWAPEVSQVAVRVIVTVCSPAWPEFSAKLAFPLAIWLRAAVQPDGSAAMQGRKAAEGTAWAARIIVWPGPQSGAGEVGTLTGSNRPMPKTAGTAKMASIAAARLTLRTLQRCSTMGCRCGASLRNSASRSRGSRFMKARSCVGLATPRVAAKASASSASVK